MSMQEDGSGEPVPPQRSGCGRAFLIIFAIVGIIALLCCAGLGIVLWKLRNAFSNDPAVVRENTSTITDIDIPDSFRPVSTVSVLSMTGVMYAAEDGKGMLLLGGIQEKNGSKERETQLKTMLAQQKQQQGQNQQLETVSKEEREFQIRGEPAKFEFVVAKDKSTGKEFRVVSGTFAGKSGLAGLMLEVPADEFDEAAVEKIVESIK